MKGEKTSEVKISNNCLEGYLTLECVTCPFWKNEKDCTGCAYPGPIDHCDAFHKVWEERSKEYEEEER